MSEKNALQRYFVKSALFCLLAFFLIPAITLGFTLYVKQQQDQVFVEWVVAQIDDEAVPAEEITEFKTFLTNNPPSLSCSQTILNPYTEQPLYHDEICEVYSERWQFYQMERASKWLIIAGIIGLLSIGALGLIAFVNRKLQYISFVIGWRFLILSCVLEIILQGLMLIWLSFWVSAFFLNIFSVKLILFIAALVGVGVFYALARIFKRLPDRNQIEGTVLSRIDAPALWERIDQLAEKLDTRAPDQVIAGIDDNFYVTEVPVTVQEKTYKGRTLYISIPLLRILDTAEADSVLAHELCHLQGGDTANSAALAPKIMQFDLYTQTMYENIFSRIVYYPLNLFRLIFEFALKRESRHRERIADQAAAQAVSAQAITHSLIKIAAYSSYRAQTEYQLFSHNQQHADEVGIAEKVDHGLHDYARSERFIADINSTHIPHPFDSHPPLTERMQNVNHLVDSQQYGEIVTQQPAHTWVDLIPTATDIEKQFWAQYEKDFSDNHEQALAYRYEPANEEEEQLVLKYFPPVVFDLKGNQQIEIQHGGLLLPQALTLLSFDQIKDVQYTDGYLADVMILFHPDTSVTGKKSTKVKLPGISKQRERFKEILGFYWHRHQTMRAQQLIDKMQEEAASLEESSANQQ